MDLSNPNAAQNNFDPNMNWHRNSSNVQPMTSKTFFIILYYYIQLLKQYHLTEVFQETITEVFQVLCLTFPNVNASICPKN